HGVIPLIQHHQRTFFSKLSNHLPTSLHRVKVFIYHNTLMDEAHCQLVTVYSAVEKEIDS
ncbi:hypothetical protein SB780_38075, partial [Burkholderia sp. SIMBA_057]